MQLNQPLRFAILTITDSRTIDTDQSGKVIRQLLGDEGFETIEYRICKDDIKSIQMIIARWVNNTDIDVIITSGGTGISKRDCTIEAIQPLINKELTGFGELFRLLSFMEDVGTRALLSRSIAGTIKDKIVFALPGSYKAVRFAMRRLIIPEINHLVSEVKKQST